MKRFLPVVTVFIAAAAGLCLSGCPDPSVPARADYSLTYDGNGADAGDVPVDGNNSGGIRGGNVEQCKVIWWRIRAFVLQDEI
jgi:hypothetical protein